MTSEERQIRSRLTKLVAGAGFLRATPAVRVRVCGKPGCRCVRGKKHASLYLEVSQDGKKKQLFISKSYESRVRTWVTQYQRIWNLLEKVSRLHWERIRRREV